MSKNYQEGAEKVARVGYAMQGAGDLILSLGSIATGYMGAMSYLKEHVQGLLLLGLCSLAAVFVYLIFDAGKKDLAPFVISLIFGKKDRITASEKMPWFFHLFAFIALALMVGGSLFANLVITPEVATKVTGDGAEQTSAYSAAIQSTNKTYEGDRAIYDQSVTEAQKAVSVIEAEAQKAVSVSVSSELTRLARGGNQWAKNEIHKAENAARNRYAGQLRRANKALEQAKAERAAFIASQGTKVTATVGALTGQLQTGNDLLLSKYDRYTGLLNWLMVCAAIMFLLGTSLYVVYEDRTGSTVSEDVSMSKLASKVWGKVYGGSIRAIDSAIDRKKNGNNMQFAMSGASTPGPTPSRPTPQSVAAASASFVSARQVTENLRQKSEEAGHCVGGVCDITDRKTDRDRKTETETEKRTETDTDRTQKTTEQTDGVGAGAYPDPSDSEAMSTFVKRVRGWHTYAREKGHPTDTPKIMGGIAFLEANKYAVIPRPDGGITVTRYKGQIEKENGEDLHTHGIWEVVNE